MTSDWLGGGLIIGLAAVLWLMYLLPTWFRRNEYNATERNVVRLQQTLRILAETSEVPDEVRAEASARSVAEHQKLLKKVAAASVPPAVRAAGRIRRARAVTTGILLLSLTIAVLGGVQTAVNGAWIILVAGVLASTLCVTRLGRLAKEGRALKLPAPVAAPQPSMEPAEFDADLADETLTGLDEAERVESGIDDSGWTPVPLPKPLYTERRRLRQVSVGQPLAEGVAGSGASSYGVAEEAAVQAAIQAEEVLRQAAAQAELALRAEFAAQDARAEVEAEAEAEATASLSSEVAPAIPSRFSGMGIVDEAETGSLDVDRVLARRRAG